MAADDLTLRMRAQGARAAARELYGVEKGVRGVGSAASRTGKQSRGAAGGISRLMQTMTGTHSAAGALTVGIGALGAGLAGYAIKSAMGFEKQLSELGAVSDATGAQMASLRTQAMKAGADTAYSAKEAALAQTELAKGGMSVKNIMGGGLNSALALAAAGQLDLGDAAAYTANAMNIFKVNGKDSMTIADGMATAANTTTADVSDFGMALSQTGGVAKLAGLSFQDTMVGLEALAAAGVKNSDAGTSMKTAMIQLLNPTKKQGKLAKELGLNFIGANGKMKSMSDISRVLRANMGQMTQAQRASALATLAGTDGVRALNALYDAGPKKLDAYKKGLNRSGSAAETARKKQDNLSGDLEKLQGSAETLGITIGTALLPYLRDASQAATTFINGIQDGTGAGGQFVDVLVAAGTDIKNVSTFLYRNRTAVLALTGALLAGIVAYRATKVALGFLSMVRSAILFYKLWRDGTLALAVAQMGLNGAMALNPVGLVVAGIVALIAIFAVAYAKVGWFREGIQFLWRVFKLTPIGFVISQFGKLIGALWGVRSKIGDAFSGIWDGMKAGLVDMLNWAIDKINSMIDGFNKVNPFGDVGTIGEISSPGDQPAPVAAAAAVAGMGTPTSAAGAARRTGARARGGPVNQAGWYDVGERGRERVFLPKGSNVEANPAGAGGSDGGETVVHAHFHVDGKEVATSVLRAAKKKKAVR
jgi:TP901 family phage tail tape measure protein